MKGAAFYLHGKGGNVEEAEHYKPLLHGWDVFALDYKGSTPWETKAEIQAELGRLKEKYPRVLLIANSIGAYFAMNAIKGVKPDRAFFISPIVDMERLIKNMMLYSGVSEAELKEKKEIDTSFGERLSWEYLSYVRENPINWQVRTDILYGEKDALTSIETVSEFAKRTNASLTVMEQGEHWFHTPAQLDFLDKWLAGLITSL